MGGTSSGTYLQEVADSEPRRFCLNDPLCHLGRANESAIVLLGHEVSRRHALVQRTECGDYYLIDLGSRNGTLLNNRRIAAPVLLRDGDRIRIGSHEFVFHGGAAAGPGRKAESQTDVDISQRLITIAVADIRDYTGLTRRLGETRISEVISAFMREAGAILSAQGAFAQKYIGDAVMAVWRHEADPPAAHELLGVFAALAGLFDAAAGLQLQFGLDAPIRLGAGVNTGLACVGNVGSEAASDYTALSDAVNLCFRLEPATKQLGCDVAMGRKTYGLLAALDGVAVLFDGHEMELKGYERPVPVYAASVASLRSLLELLRRHSGLPVGQTTPATAAVR